MYLAFDPGGTTGWFKFDNAGNEVAYGQVDEEQLHEQIEIWCDEAEKDPVIAVICEDFIIRRNKAQKFAGSRMQTIQVIGIIKAFARRVDAGFILQDSQILPIAEKHTQVKMPKDHSQSHWVSAFLHGAEWLIRQGIRKTALEMEQEK